MSTLGYTKKILDVGGRKFLVQLLSFDNGTFVSVGSGPPATSATVIPTKTDSFFLKLIAEKISTSIKGIGVVSLYADRELGNECSKILMGEIMEMVRA